MVPMIVLGNHGCLLRKGINNQDNKQEDLKMRDRSYLFWVLQAALHDREDLGYQWDIRLERLASLVYKRPCHQSKESGLWVMERH